MSESMYSELNLRTQYEGGTGSCLPVMAAGRNLDIHSWLMAMGMQEHAPAFSKYSRMEEIVSFTERELQMLGIRDGAHVARMAASLAMLREKLNKKGKNKTPGTSPKGSTNVSPASVCNHPDYATSAQAISGVPPLSIMPPDYVPIQIPFQQHSQQLGYIQMAPSPTDGPEASQELYKYLWYHGSVPRQRAENLVLHEGDFLVRDSISQPGNYVMTCCWHAQPLHFVIDRTLKTDSSGNTVAQYAFEQQAFPRVSELIQHYIALRKPVSDKSGALITTPVNRTVHPGEYDMRMTAGKMTPMGTPASAGRGGGSQSHRNSPHPSPFGSPTGTPSGSPQMARRGNIPRRKGSQPLLDHNGCEGVCRRGSAPMMRPSTSSHVMPSSGSAPIMRQPTTPPAAALSQQGVMAPLSVAKHPSGSHVRPSISSDSLADLPMAPPAPCCVQAAQHPAKPCCASPRPIRKVPCDVSPCGPACGPHCGIPPSKSPNPSLSRSPNPSFSRSTSQPGFSKSPNQSFLSHVQPDICRSCTPPPKPSRVPKSGKPKPYIPIRNKDLYADDGKDYSDYSQVKAWSGSTPAPESFKQSSSAPPSRQTSRGDDEEYDNNFSLASRMKAEADYDIPKSSKVKVPEKKDEVPVPSDDDLTPTQENGVKKDVYAMPNKKPKENGEKVEETKEKSPSKEEITPVKLPKMTMTLPDLDPPSAFDLAGFKTDFLPADNKPLDGNAMKSLKNLLLTAEPRRLAQHITYIDLELAKVTGKQHLGVGVFSGLEYLTLPQGHQMRMDLTERHHTMAKFVSLSILVCAKFPERIQMLHQWIQTANELRGFMGNMYGFAAVMAGIRTQQVQRLHNTWISLKQRFPHSSFLAESKLGPAIRAMDEGGTSLPLQNVTVPHVLPLMELLEREHDLTTTTDWENSKADYGLDILLAHLDTARVITEQYGLYRVTAENLLQEFKPQSEFLDMFKTEFHLNLLWGAKGAGVNFHDRHNKFEQLLGVLSERAEKKTTQDGGETSL